MQDRSLFPGQIWVHLKQLYSTLWCLDSDTEEQ